MIKKGFQLKAHNTFGVEVNAATFITLESESEALKLLRKKELNIRNTIILGGGSNVLFTKDYTGTVLHPLFNSIEIIARGEKTVFVAAEAGAVWDDLVAWSVENNLGGIENLSYIPGTVGAAPIQNIGAYGAEVCNTIVKVSAISIKDGTIREFLNEECEFGYRTSIFKKQLKGKFLITKLILELKRDPSEFNISYGDLKSRVSESGELNLHNIRNAVINIRKEKLPEPSELGNAGSFFKNPYISRKQLQEIRILFPDIPNWLTENNSIKVPAAWLIEQTGWKGYKSGEVGVHHLQPLVIINLGRATGAEILELSRNIIKSVAEKFGITLEHEVNIL